MIFDPERVDMAMDHHGNLFYRATGNINGQIIEEWRPLQEVNRPKERGTPKKGDPDAPRPHDW